MNEMIMGFFILVHLVTWYGVYRLFKSSKPEAFDMTNVLRKPSERQKAYGKSNGKHRLRVNDDTTAAQIELDQ